MDSQLRKTYQKKNPKAVNSEGHYIGCGGTLKDTTFHVEVIIDPT